MFAAIICLFLLELNLTAILPGLNYLTGDKLDLVATSLFYLQPSSSIVDVKHSTLFYSNPRKGLNSLDTYYIRYTELKKSPPV